MGNKDFILKLLFTELCLTLCKPVDCRPAISYVYSISQARILEWIAIPFSRVSSWLKNQAWVFCIGRQILYHLSHCMLQDPEQKQ